MHSLYCLYHQQHLTMSSEVNYRPRDPDMEVYGGHGHVKQTEFNSYTDTPVEDKEEKVELKRQVVFSLSHQR